MNHRDESRILARDHGIILGEIQGYLDRENYGADYSLAMDAQPSLITVSNGGIPAFLANYLDPKFVEVLVAPMKAEEVTNGATKKGDWTTLTAMFPIVESTGEVSSYGDWNNNGSSNVNVNWESRQSYHFQTITNWGERQMDMAGEARIDWAARLNIASALTLNKAMNKIYFFGVANLLNYGLLNDPSLLSPITPAASGTGSGTLWSTKTGDLVYADLQTLFAKLVTQAVGYVDANTRMTLAMSPGASTNLAKTNSYGINLGDLLKKNFPNLRIVTAVEYDTSGGSLVQLIADEVEGQKTADVAFTEKLRAHPVKVGLSAFRQKKSAGSWGAIIYRPFLIAQMLGV